MQRMTVDSFNNFVQKWITPATVVLMFGAVVWGVQLNFITLQHADSIAVNKKTLFDLDRRLTAAEFRAERTAILLDQAADRLSRLSVAVSDHNREAENWKIRIQQNTDAINHQRNEVTNNGGFQ